jgi:hypothetical protein
MRGRTGMSFYICQSQKVLILALAPSEPLPGQETSDKSPHGLCKPLKLLCVPARKRCKEAALPALGLASVTPNLRVPMLGITCIATVRALCLSFHLSVVM